MDRLTRCFFPAAIGAAWLCLAPRLFSQERFFDVDPAQSRVEFTLGDVFHTVRGSFKVKQGTIRVDPAIGKAGGLVVVDATSGESGNGARDRKMHKDILESGKYPEISIEPVKASGTLAASGESQIELNGIFRIHGGEHEVTVSAAVQIAGDQWTARIHFIVPYVQWGLKNPSTFILRVSDKVAIDVLAKGRVRPSPEP